jgi:hypothetical protein
VTIGGRINAEAVAYGPDVFRTAKQADTVSMVLKLLAMLFEQLTKLTHVLHIYVAVRTHAPLSGHVVGWEFHRHQTEGFSTFLDGGRLG